MFIVFAINLSFDDLGDRYLAVLLLQFVLLAYMAGYWIVAMRVAYEDSWTRSVFKFLGLIIIFLPILAGSIEFVAHI